MPKTWTITFSECVENHAGMEKIGEECDEGFSVEELVKIKKRLGDMCEIYDLSKLLSTSSIKKEEAMILVVRNGVDEFFYPNERILFDEEVRSMEDIVDKQALMRGKLVNKHARWNLCYADIAQVADIEKGKGTIVSFRDVPYLKRMRDDMCLMFEEIRDKVIDLNAELNYYYDVNKCGIGYHGDSERRKVIGVRIGASMNLCYRWYMDSEPIGNALTIQLNSGDMYIMSSKAVGNDWKKRKVPTLRHAAGCKKYTLV